jgi:hypothetical protein
MGKKQHAKDKLYILHTEWKYVICASSGHLFHDALTPQPDMSMAGSKATLPEAACVFRARPVSTSRSAAAVGGDEVTCVRRYKTLPFHCCALTLQDFKDAM